MFNNISIIDEFDSIIHAKYNKITMLISKGFVKFDRIIYTTAVKHIDENGDKYIIIPKYNEKNVMDVLIELIF